jgi:hypothetical protein
MSFIWLNGYKPQCPIHGKLRITCTILPRTCKVPITAILNYNTVTTIHENIVCNIYLIIILEWYKKINRLVLNDNSCSMVRHPENRTMTEAVTQNASIMARFWTALSWYIVIWYMWWSPLECKGKFVEQDVTSPLSKIQEFNCGIKTSRTAYISIKKW